MRMRATYGATNLASNRTHSKTSTKMVSPEDILSSSGVENTSNNTDLECLNFTRSTAKALLALKVSLSVVAISSGS